MYLLNLSDSSAKRTMTPIVNRISNKIICDSVVVVVRYGHTLIQYALMFLECQLTTSKVSINFKDSQPLYGL